MKAGRHATEKPTLMKSDIEIARSIDLLPITEISGKMGIPSDALEPYGKYMAKVPSDLIDE